MFFKGKNSVTIKGSIPPTVNAAPDANAACIGLALLISFIPNSSRICAPKTSVLVNSFATIKAVSFLILFFHRFQPIVEVQFRVFHLTLFSHAQCLLTQYQFENLPIHIHLLP